MSWWAARTTSVTHLRIASLDPFGIELVLPELAILRVGSKVVPVTIGAPAFVRTLDLLVGRDRWLRLGVALAGTAHKTVKRNFMRSTTAFADAGSRSTAHIRMAPFATLLAPRDADAA